MDHSKKGTYNYSIDALRVVAILAVILIHITTDVLARLKLNIEIAPFVLFVNQASRFAVPLFFLISGFVLELNNKNLVSFFPFFKKRAYRLLLPYLFWSLTYFFLVNGFSPSSITNTKLWQAVFLGTASYHLYFIPTLILFYVSFPFLHNALPVLKKTSLLLPILIIQTVLLAYDYYVSPLKLPYDIRVALLNIGMFLAGMLSSLVIEKISKFVKKNFIALLVGALFLLLFIFFQVYNLTLELKTSRFIYNQYGPLNYLYTVILGSVLYYFFESTQFARKVFIVLSRLSLFVFFIHVLVLNWFWEIVDALRINEAQVLASFWFVVAIFIAVSLTSFAFAFIAHKVPFVRRITG